MDTGRTYSTFQILFSCLGVAMTLSCCCLYVSSLTQKAMFFTVPSDLKPRGVPYWWSGDFLSMWDTGSLSSTCCASCRGHLAPGSVCQNPFAQQCLFPFSLSSQLTQELTPEYPFHGSITRLYLPGPPWELNQSQQPSLWPKWTDPRADLSWGNEYFSGGQRELEGSLFLGVSL